MMNNTLTQYKTDVEFHEDQSDIYFREQLKKKVALLNANHIHLNKHDSNDTCPF